MVVNLDDLLTQWMWPRVDMGVRKRGSQQHMCMSHAVCLIIQYNSTVY